MSSTGDQLSMAVSAIISARDCPPESWVSWVPGAKGSPARQVFDAANSLAGEPFAPGTQLTQLSGGQSRALMIADTAILSWSPVLLIDEIENAGVDKRRALDLLLSTDKIIVMATHDPEDLKVFGTLKARAVSLLDRHGVRFLDFNNFLDAGQGVPVEGLNLGALTNGDNPDRKSVV